jgi:alcohol dehydrogenase
VATVAAAFRLAEPIEGGSVAILGCGVLGLMACAMARSLGADEVIACDLDPAREDLAREFGASRFTGPGELTALTRDLTSGRGADLAMEFSGSGAAVTGAIESCRTGGTAVIAGTTTPGTSITLDPNQLVRRMLSLKGLHNYAPADLVTALDFLTRSTGRFPFDSLTGGNYRLEDIENAFAMSSSRAGLRTAVLP